MTPPLKKSTNAKTVGYESANRKNTGTIMAREN